MEAYAFHFEKERYPHMTLSRNCRLLFLAMLLALASCSLGYTKHGNSISYKTWDEASGNRYWEVAAADTASFVVLNGDYGKDKYQAYFRQNPIQGSDTKTFVVLSNLYAKDRQQAYFNGVPIIGSDPTTFRLAKEDFAQDKNDIFLHRRAIGACSPQTFRWLADSWQLDDKCAYRRGTKITGADVASFVALSFFYAKDRNHVYSSAPLSVVVGADPETFVLVSDMTGRDKNGCYHYSDKKPC
jgi:hypothetical protein